MSNSCGDAEPPEDSNLRRFALASFLTVIDIVGASGLWKSFSGSPFFTRVDVNLSAEPEEIWS
ncbi:hypothetical protein PanWU01x14_325560 [Parasponia andersonii]|uniref:Uncharacterized protein n=1 Tax=Parasponia andersonii TaxID=3476 RepID=A0A2P5AJQ9_PARAD|nr:hypothetical protein PanWU01x14_325560 [Parasponia andersonii]